MRKTKIIATLGPATSNKSTLCKLMDVGVDIVRINMSHISKIRRIFPEHPTVPLTLHVPVTKSAGWST